MSMYRLACKLKSFQHFSTSIYRSLTKMATAGVIVIGDEILKGYTQDTNSHFICKTLHGSGVRVKRVSVISDNVDEIASEVSLFSKMFTYVITTGGIGPTHDDVTYDGICAAFDDHLEMNPEVLNLFETFLEHLKPTSKENSDAEGKSVAGRKMAELPSTCKLHYGDGYGEKRLLYPIASVNNVYIFPGIPSLLQRSFNTICGSLFVSSSQKLHLNALYVKDDEWSITEKLNQTVNKYKELVTFGSYPVFFNQYYKVKITIESKKHEAVEEASTYFKSLFPKGKFADMEMSSVTESERYVYGLLNEILILDKANEVFKCHLRNSLDVIEQCLNKYRQREIVLSFNGGKDCTVLLHLFAAVLSKGRTSQQADKIAILYVHESNSFPEMETFLNETIEKYDLRVIKYQEMSIKNALEKLKQDHEDVQAVLVGTRASDPYSSKLKPFCKTDTDWPQFMRVMPMLDWNYSDVWIFLRSLNLSYCSLYDEGYTSLGHEGNTKPNPQLKYVDNQGNTKYKPAYELSDYSAERNGRQS